MTATAGYNLTTADSSTMVYSFFNGAGARVCDFSVLGAREDILNTSMVRIPNLLDLCPGLVSGGYVMQMHVNALAPSIMMAVQIFNYTQWTGYPVVVNVAVGGDRSVQISNPDEPDALSAQLFGAHTAKVVVSQVPYDRCTYSASPLVIQLQDPGPIRLTPPLQGVPFDILGANVNPPHTLMQISWFTAESARRNYVLALPDARGEVHGIDELFGDNTTGPDGKMPAKDEEKKLRNGYEALRKWDGRREDGSYIDRARDGFIRPDDPVFAKLRLWLDINHDGVAQPEELSTLEAKQVVAIDLDYNRDFVETDPYGNSTRMKSVAQTADGQLHLMYDLWFRAMDRSVVPAPLVAGRPTTSGRAIASVPDEAPMPVRSEPAPAPPTEPARGLPLLLTAAAFLIVALALIFVP